MLGLGTGTVAWAEQFIPSGWAALLVTTVPLWMVLLDWLWKGGDQPSKAVWAGFGVGFLGVALLFEPTALLSSFSIESRSPTAPGKTWTMLWQAIRSTEKSSAATEASTGSNAFAIFPFEVAELAGSFDR